MAKDGEKDRNKEKDALRRRRFWNAVRPVVDAWVKISLGFEREDFEPADIEGPILVAVNHTCAYDPLLVGAAFRNKPLTFIATEHLLRSKWGPFLNKYCSLIPHMKGARSSRTALVAMKRIKKGESIFIAVEGEQSWDGRPNPVMPYTGKLVKGSGATLVTYLLEGAYLTAPRWALHRRKGKVYGRPAGVYSPEMLKEMSDDEVEKLIAKDLAFDIWEWQKKRPEGPVIYKCRKGGFADGLERMVFTCPSCGRFGTLSSQGDSIGCDCGFRVRMKDTGFFEEGSQFETVADWGDHDRKKLEARLSELSAGAEAGAPGPGAGRDRGDKAAAGRAAGEDCVFADDCVVLHRITDGHSDEEAARGRLTLSLLDGHFMLRIGDYSFSLEGISNMTMVLANRIVFSDESGYYELLSAKNSRTNLIKYVTARDILMNL